jgi:hypothetical protein
MDVKKVAGLLMVIVIAVPIVATAPPGTLALMELGLIGLLYVIRCRRWNTRARYSAAARP